MIAKHKALDGRTDFIYMELLRGFLKLTVTNLKTLKSCLLFWLIQKYIFEFYASILFSKNCSFYSTLYFRLFLLSHWLVWVWQQHPAGQSGRMACGRFLTVIMTIFQVLWELLCRLICILMPQGRPDLVPVRLAGT